MSKPTLRDVFEFIRFSHADAEKLSFHRVMLTAYLADWRSALTWGEQITEVIWTLERLFSEPEGPTWRLTGRAFDPPDWESMKTARDEAKHPFTPQQKDALTFVIRVAESKDFAELLQLVSSTYPVLTQEYEDVPLNLVALADKYKHLASQ